MKWMSYVVAVALAVGSIGPITAESKEKDEKVTLKVSSDVTLKPGESKEIKVTVNRPDDDEVTVKIDNLPKAVSVDLSSVKVKKGDKTAAFVLKIDKDAKEIQEVENHKAKAVATYKGTGYTETFNVTVKKK